MSFWDLFFILLIWVPLIILWTAAVLDIFKRDDIGGLPKVLWILVILVFPLVGALVYLVIRPPGTTARERALAAEDSGNVLHGAPPGSAQELSVLADLHDRGKLSDEEFQLEKSRRIDPEAIRPLSVREQRGGQL